MTRRRDRSSPEARQRQIRWAVDQLRRSLKIVLNRGRGDDGERELIAGLLREVEREVAHVGDAAAADPLLEVARALDLPGLEAWVRRR